jgi:outer membrane murein-binding lipoprotein Lpp
MKRMLLLALCGVALGSPAYAGCTAPKPPGAIPDGKTSSKDQMMAAKKDVDQYKKDVEAYISCETNSSRAESAQADLERTANKFNAEVRAFKAANADG